MVVTISRCPRYLPHHRATCSRCGVLERRVFALEKTQPLGRFTDETTCLDVTRGREGVDHSFVCVVSTAVRVAPLTPSVRVA